MTETSRECPVDELEGLMRRYQQGDATAFDRIFRLMTGTLRGYFLSRRLPLEKAEDLLQETFLQIHRARHTYQPGRPARPWFLGVARHVYLMDRRAAAALSRRNTQPLEGAPEPAVDPAQLLLGDRQRVGRAVSELSEGNRQTLLMHHVWGMSFKEVAAALGIREGAAKVRSHRALRDLRLALEES